MAQPLIDPGRPEPQQTRVDFTLAHIARAWSVQPRGRRFAAALVDFLRATGTTATLRAYSYAVLEFFEYYERERRTLPTPDQIRRADAADYDRWLRERDYGLRRWRLEQDPRRRLDLAVYEFVREHPGADIAAIRAELGRHAEFVTTDYRDGRIVRVLRIDVDAERTGGLARHLSCLVRSRTLQRTPTVEQVRAERRRQGVVDVAAPVDPAIFRYTVPQQPRPPGPTRASTVAARLTALASFWSYLASSGENVRGEREPLLRYNIWLEPLKRAREQAPSHQAASRAATTTTAPLFERLLATTYQGAYGARAPQAAQAVTRGAQAPPSSARESFADLRDRALLLVMLQAGGPRASEVTRLRRRDVQGDPALLSIVGKGGRARTLPVPPAALDALRQLTAKLRQLAAHQQRYGRRNRAAALLEPDAPLLPAIRYWGRNAGLSPKRGLSRQGITMMLRRRAVLAGIEPGTAEFRRIHPHGIRHLFAKMAIESGTRLNVVQAMMGHASGATTLRYMEERAPEALVSAAFEPPVRAPERPVEPPPAPPPELPRVPPKPPERPPRPRIEPELPPVVRVMPVEEVEEPAEPLIGVGEPPAAAVPAEVVAGWRKRLKRQLTGEEIDELAQCYREPSDPLQRLCSIYTLDWGERGKGQRQRVSLSPAELAMLQSAGRAGAGPAAELEARDLTRRLEHTYAGVHSGLCWWAGTNGDLRPEMPVLSAEQAGRCDPEVESAVCAGLVELWQRWMGGAEAGSEVQPELRQRGPMAAAALVEWIAEALETAAQLQASVVDRGGRWVAAAAAWDDTVLGGSKAERPPRMVFREHVVDRVLGWFEEVAWQYRVGRGRLAGGTLERSERARKVKGGLPKVPDWYGQVDPIAALPHREREELLDLVSVLSGQPLEDRTRRGSGWSRRELGAAIELMRRYDLAQDEIRDLKARRRRGEGVQADIAAWQDASRQAAAEVDRHLRALGAPAETDFAKEVRGRVKLTKAAGLKGHSRGAFYLALLGQLFGEEITTDPLLTMAASGFDPLREHAELLRVDRARGTIVHEPAFAQRFAQETGAHSECVARRMARQLYELHRTGGKGAGAFQRRKDLLDLAEGLLAYRVPCPQAQEYELRERLGAPAEALPVYEAWRAAREEIERLSEAEVLEELMQRELLEEFVGFEEEFAPEIAAAYAGEIVGGYEPNQQRHHRYTRRAATLLPTPVELVWAALLPPR